MPHSTDPFSTKTPELLALTDSVKLMPFLAAKYFGDKHSGEPTPIEKRVKGSKIILALKGFSAFVICEAHETEQEMQVNMAKAGTDRSYVCITWDDTDLTYLVQGFVTGEGRAEEYIHRQAVSAGVEAEVRAKEPDGRLKAIAQGSWNEGGPTWTHLAYALPWSGLIQKEHDIIFGPTDIFGGKRITCLRYGARGKRSDC